jgi:hypothetical protein
MMGVYDTLIDGGRSVQIKIFGDSYETYEVGDQLPCDGSFIIVLPDYEDAPFAIIKDGIFLGLTDCPPIIVDKWGGHIVSYDAFKSPESPIEKALSQLGENSE